MYDFFLICFDTKLNKSYSYLFGNSIKPTSKGLKGKQGGNSKQRSFVNSPILSLTTQKDLGVLNPPLNLTFGHTVKVRCQKYVI